MDFTDPRMRTKRPTAMTCHATRARGIETNKNHPAWCMVGSLCVFDPFRGAFPPVFFLYFDPLPSSKTAASLTEWAVIIPPTPAKSAGLPGAASSMRAHPRIRFSSMASLLVANEEGGTAHGQLTACYTRMDVTS
jgi:hypothetical protein